MTIHLERTMIKTGETIMTELEKLDAGLPFDVNDPEVDARKLHAVMGCRSWSPSL